MSPVLDETGRCIAPPQTVLAERPMGPWTHNGLHIVCGWCQIVMVEGDRTQHTSHGMCPSCAITFEQEIA